ncbi:hypothetical protein HYH03_012035 [Edaphochlamys debaryana]|uniref:Uncharacterized protein n=1 Tax=Edaphochlamys debaryana TaxID=47281 RepID=A0A835XSG5_9CHLO|nr:hypothetical protein HYH03_012035 [Edaphochlamys debaryana]|eukprot:KAG2489393.1 hypothetical protein HYH03_012035 [Edaphochlamys debaryana]
MAEDCAQQVFIKYASIGKTGITLANATVDGAKFAKLCRESRLGIPAPDVEAIYMKVMRGKARMNYETFLLAMKEVCARKHCSMDAIFNRIAEADPLAATTKAEYVRHHDDKDTYTGVYRGGGPRNMAGSA